MKGSSLVVLKDESDPPDSISLHDFMATENFGRLPFSQSRNPFTCGLTGKTYSASEAGQRADFLARAIARKLDFSPNEGVEWDKVVAIFSLNAVGRPLLKWPRESPYIS
jgi:hypothetical protein